MKKKTKIVLGFLGFIVMMVIAVVGAVIIAKANLKATGQIADNSASAEGSIVVEYTDDENTATTVTFEPGAGMCKVSVLASGLYKMDYETTYSVEDGVLTITDVSAIEAKDESGVAAMLSLPAEFEANIVHTVDGRNIKIALSGEPFDGKVLFDMLLDDEKAAALGVD